jgi:hypothetical protein
MATFSSYAAPTTTLAAATPGYMSGYPQLYAGGFAAGPAPGYAAQPAAQTYPGPNGKGYDIKEEPAGTEISPEICKMIGVPVGSKWGPAPPNPYAQQQQGFAVAAAPGVAYAGYPSQYATIGGFQNH